MFIPHKTYLSTNISFALQSCLSRKSVFLNDRDYIRFSYTYKLVEMTRVQHIVESSCRMRIDRSVINVGQASRGVSQQWRHLAINPMINARWHYRTRVCIWRTSRASNQKQRLLIVMDQLLARVTFRSAFHDLIKRLSRE